MGITSALLAQAASTETSPGVALAALAIVATAVGGLVKVVSNSTQRGDNAQAEHIRYLIEDRAATEERANKATAEAAKRAEEATREAERCRQTTEIQARDLTAQSKDLDDLRIYVRILTDWLKANGMEPPPWPQPHSRQ